MVELFERVLIPTDFSEYSRKTIEYSKELSDVGVKEIVLFHAGLYDPFVLSLARVNIDDYVAKIKEKAEKNLDEQANILREFGLQVRTRFIATSNDPADAIIDVVEDEYANLIVMGSKGHNWLKQKLLGGVTEEVIRRSKVPILIMRFEMEEKEGEFHLYTSERILEKVIFCFDTSDVKEEILEFMKRIVSINGSVILLHVVDKSKPEIEEAVKTANEKLNALKSRVENVSNDGANVEVRIRHGNPVKEILKESEDGTLVVVCSKGKTGEEEVGKTADSVIRHSKVPVMVFK
jgi:nucleotide-binding universal stress UspA family protein